MLTRWFTLSCRLIVPLWKGTIAIVVTVLAFVASINEIAQLPDSLEKLQVKSSVVYAILGTFDFLCTYPDFFVIVCIAASILWYILVTGPRRRHKRDYMRDWDVIVNRNQHSKRGVGSRVEGENDDGA